MTTSASTTPDTRPPSSHSIPGPGRRTAGRPESTSRASTPRTTRITHRYPWSVEERVIIGLCTFGPALLTAGLWLAGGVAQETAIVAHAVGLGLAAALWRLGASRKNASMVVAELTGTRLHVVGGRVKSSRGDINRTRAVDVQVLGPETVLVLTAEGGAVLRVPMRIAGYPALASVLLPQLRRQDVTVSPAARVALDSL